MDQKIATNNSLKSLVWNMHDSVVNGVVMRDLTSNIVYVETESQLSQFVDRPAGTFAATYGLTGLWQLKPDKTWATVYETT